MEFFKVLVQLQIVGVIVLGVAIAIAVAVSGFAVTPKFLNPTGYQPLGCGQNVHSYVIARDCGR